MKTILKSITLFTAVALFAGCNKAENKTVDFVSFTNAKYTVTETSPSIKIPVYLESMSGKEISTTVTFEIVGGTAVEGVDYTLPAETKAGVLNISTDPAKCDSIEVRPIDMSGVITKNTTIQFKLTAAVKDGVELGNTSVCTLTIIDVDGGLNLLVGNWSGYKDSVGFDFELALMDESNDTDKEALAYYPEANIKLLEGFTFKDASGNAWEALCDVYAKYNEETSELWIFPEQVFDGGNFGEPYGVMYVAVDADATVSGTPTNVVFAITDDVMTLTTVCGAYLYKYDDDDNLVYTQMWCGALPMGLELRKQ